MKRVKIGVIGCGYWGPKLARNFSDIPEADLSWVSDFRADRLVHMRELCPKVQVTQHYREILSSDVDAVVIATPVSTHHALAMEVLRAGKHVLIEKPLATKVSDAIEIASEADRLGLVAMVGHTFQFNPAVNVIRDLIRSGELGEVYYVNSTRVNLGLFQTDTDVVWDLAPHDISILLHILGMEPNQVSAQGKIYIQKEYRLHEVAYITLHFPKNILANIRVSWLDPVKQRRITIVGSKKMLVYDDIRDEKVVLYDKGVEIPTYSDTPEEFQLSYRHGPGIPVAFQWQEPLRLECEAFVRSIKTSEPPCSDAWTGVKVVRILETAQKSLLNGGGKEKIL